MTQEVKKLDELDETKFGKCVTSCMKLSAGLTKDVLFPVLPKEDVSFKGKLEKMIGIPSTYIPDEVVSFILFYFISFMK